MRQPGDEPGGDQRRITRREDGGRIADRERDHERDEQGPTRGPGGECRDDRCTHDHAQRIGADDVSGLRLGDTEAMCDVGQQPHRHEFGCPDPESTYSKCENRASASAW